MDAPDDDPLNRQLFRTNLAGLGLVVVLLGLFAWLYGKDLLSFLLFLSGQAPQWP